ncbi:prephenate dehydrogenase (NADP(+)) [Phlyctochytrium planicorne]|nr:prephenate dehydrogenase (NADP(+)) [Phlyctochytrium planicorne]
MILEKASFAVGIIGAGEMGRLYARKIAAAGWGDGFAVSRRCDYIIYSVEAGNFAKVVEKYGPATKLNAIVGGQTSVKEPEIQAFEQFLPPDVQIVTCHSMHGPGVDPQSQMMVVIRHKCDEARYGMALEVLKSLGSHIVYLSYKEHDIITADTQAYSLTSLGLVWGMLGRQEATIQIYSNKWHVYAGLAILNPSARQQVQQYAVSVSELFRLMIQQKNDEFRQRVMEAGEYVFGISATGDSEVAASPTDRPLLLSPEMVEDFAKSVVEEEHRPPPQQNPRKRAAEEDLSGNRKAPRFLNPNENSHLSLLAIADCWKQLGMNPYDHMKCQTPLFGLWIGITEHLFRTPHLLKDAIDASLFCLETRADDMLFVSSVAGWSECIEQGHFEAYRDRFEKVSRFFFDESNTPDIGAATARSRLLKVGNQMIGKVANEMSRARQWNQ